MTLDEAKASIGKPVTYQDCRCGPLCWCEPADGVITYAGNQFAFVRFAGQQASKACSPADLTLMA